MIGEMRFAMVAATMGERNDCTVRALAVALDIPYETSHARLAQLGRKPKHGFPFYRAAEALKANRLALPSQRRVTVGSCLAIPRLAAGRYVVRVAKHVFAVVDGVPSERINPRQVVTSVWDFTASDRPAVAEEPIRLSRAVQMSLF
jgi:hypothetical protein